MGTEALCGMCPRLRARSQLVLVQASHVVALSHFFFFHTVKERASHPLPRAYAPCRSGRISLSLSLSLPLPLSPHRLRCLFFVSLSVSLFFARA